MTNTAPTHRVTFQYGNRVGARRFRTEYVVAGSDADAIKEAKKLFPEWKEQHYRVVNVVNEQLGY